MLNWHLVKSSIRVGVVHACIEVVTLVPVEESGGPLLVDVINFGTVVVPSDILVV